MPFGGPNSERALILAPRGRDAEVASKLLRDAGWPTLICTDVARLCEELGKGAGFGTVVEEALATDDLAALVDCIKAQPAWSDFPIIVLTGRGDMPERNALSHRLQDILGNVTFLERPFHPTTLASVARSAMRSRRRQYQTRELLERRDLLTRELQHRTKNLLAVIQAIASASLRESQGREAFFNRLHALAKAQDLIIEGAARGALMTQVVRNALESFGTRVLVDGPEVFLNPNAAQGFALIMHELATNAAKHGSLTTESGTVSGCAGRLIPARPSPPSSSNGKSAVDLPSRPPRAGASALFCSNARSPLLIRRHALTIPEKGSLTRLERRSPNSATLSKVRSGSVVT
jgi:two-component sensor histidine kinase